MSAWWPTQHHTAGSGIYTCKNGIWVLYVTETTHNWHSSKVNLMQNNISIKRKPGIIAKLPSENENPLPEKQKRKRVNVTKSTWIYVVSNCTSWNLFWSLPFDEIWTEYLNALWEKGVKGKERRKRRKTGKNKAKALCSLIV